MALEISGRLKQILAETRGQGKNNTEWVKRDFLIELDGPYPKSICFTAWGDKAHEVAGFTPGQMLKVHFDLSSREYNTRWYTDIKAWRIDVLDGASGGSGNSSDGVDPVFPDENISASGAEDDLPF